MDTIKYKYSSKPCKLVIDENGKHTFGGRGPSIKIIGEKPNQEIHHFLTIDLSDTNSPLEASGVKFLPLFYPLKNSGGGGELQYRMLSESEIEIFEISAYDDEDFVSHSSFPEFKASIEPSNDFNEDDFRLGGDLETCQGEIFKKCKNPECDNNRWDYLFPIFAIFPAIESFHEITQIDTWGEYPEDVQFCFCICQECGMILSVNRCS